MDKIVQLRESEYDKLFQLANINEKQIQEEAEKRWKNCPARIDVNVKVNEDWDNTFKIKCYTHLSSYPLEIPYDAKRKLNDIIQKHFKRCVEEHFGEAVTVINEYKKKENYVMNNRLLLWAILATTSLTLGIITSLLA